MEYDFALILWAAYIAVFIMILGRIILRPQREPASRLAWLIATIAVPVVGILAYLLLGEARISAKRRARYASIEAHLPHPHDNAGVRRGLARSPWAAPFALAETVNALPPTAGNRARLAANSNAAIREMVEDIDNAKSTVHLCFYIWLADNNGFRIKDALVRAARGDRHGNLVFSKSARNFNPLAAMAGRITVAEVEELVEPGAIDPDAVHVPGIFVQRVVALTPEQAADKKIERRTVSG